MTWDEAYPVLKDDPRFDRFGAHDAFELAIGASYTCSCAHTVNGKLSSWPI